MQKRATKEPSEQKINDRLITIAHHCAQIVTCKWCLLPSMSGYVCYCGWDNSYDPDKYDHIDGQYRKKN